jgi:hypothetical protein
VARLDSGEVLLELVQLPQVALLDEIPPGGLASRTLPPVVRWLAVDPASGRSREVDLPVPPGAGEVGVASTSLLAEPRLGLGF